MPKIKILRILVTLKNFFDIRKDTDKEHTITSIIEGVPLRGSNIWYLICSALLASIGLDVNSPAVIIGAMLISPLMYPILGIGLSFGIHDRETLFSSSKEFSVAVGVSLLTSIIYFALSPLSTVTNEIAARTSPTLLDVGVAFFGGVAGIVAGSRSKAASAIPGVAIATALMPPVCAAGFGFAHASPKIFLGAMYLFFINTVFISLSAYLIVRMLKFPLKAYPNPAREKRMKRVIAAVILLMTIPSIFIFLQIINEVKVKNRVNSFISKNISSPNRNVIKWNLQPVSGDSLKLVIFSVGEKLEDPAIDSLNKKLADFKIENTSLTLLQVESENGFNYDELNNLMISSAELNKRVNSQLVRLDSLQNIVNNYKSDSLYKIEIANDLKIMAPSLKNIIFSSIADTIRLHDTVKIKISPEVLLEWNKTSGWRARRDDKKKIIELVKTKLKADTVIINEIK